MHFNPDRHYLVLTKKATAAFRQNLPDLIPAEGIPDLCRVRRVLVPVLQEGTVVFCRRGDAGLIAVHRCTPHDLPNQNFLATIVYGKADNGGFRKSPCGTKHVAFLTDWKRDG